MQTGVCPVVPNEFTLNFINLPEPNTPAVRIQEIDVPQLFVAEFAAKGANGFWNVALTIFLEADGSPRAREVKIYSFDERTVKTPFIQRWQIELVENEFHRLLTMAVVELVNMVVPEQDGEETVWELGRHEPTTKKFQKEVERLTHKRGNDSEHFRRVAKIYNAELKRATKSGKRPRMIKEIMDQMNTSRGTAESWVRTAKAIPGLIKPATPKKKPSPNEPIRKAIAIESKSTTTKSKKGKS